MRYSAILFDLDGTLVDTIDLYLDAFLEALAEFDQVPTRQEFERWYMQGLHLPDIMEHFRMPKEHEQPLRADRDARYERRLRTHVEWFPGAIDLLKAVTKNHKTAIVTGSWMKYVDALNTRTPIKNYIETIITADNMIPYMKPHPHGLLLGADAVKVAPEECLYVGDQMFDMEAAKAAGMESCLYVSQFTPHEAHGMADYVIKDLSELMKIAR